jgi:hypothetical protein
MQQVEHVSYFGRERQLFQTMSMLVPRFDINRHYLSTI